MLSGRASTMVNSTAVQRFLTRTNVPVKECRRYASSGHGPSYNEPSGYLFGEKPPPAGQKRVKDAWENQWYWGFYGGSAVFMAIMYFKPDNSVRAWAKPEAEKRLDESGAPWRYKPSPNSGYPNGIPSHT